MKKTLVVVLSISFLAVAGCSKRNSNASGQLGNFNSCFTGESNSTDPTTGGARKLDIVKGEVIGGIERYPSGQKKTETHFKNGRMNGNSTEWHENGQKKLDVNYKDDKAEGLVTRWYKNGQQESETHYTDGKKNGLMTIWFENGQKQSEINYKDDKVDGSAIEWFENGQVKRKGIFKDGNLIE